MIKTEDTMCFFGLVLYGDKQKDPRKLGSLLCYVEITGT